MLLEVADLQDLPLELIDKIPTNFIVTFTCTEVVHLTTEQEPEISESPLEQVGAFLLYPRESKEENNIFFFFPVGGKSIGKAQLCSFLSVTLLLFLPEGICEMVFIGIFLDKPSLIFTTDASG